jgi:hypothetical protein
MALTFQSAWVLYVQPSSNLLWHCLSCDITLRQHSRHSFHSPAVTHRHSQKGFRKHSVYAIGTIGRHFLHIRAFTFRLCPSIHRHLCHLQSDKSNIHVRMPYGSGMYFLPPVSHI